MTEPDLHVVVGSGPVGRAVAGQLADRGLSRPFGRSPSHRRTCRAGSRSSRLTSPISPRHVARWRAQRSSITRRRRSTTAGPNSCLHSCAACSRARSATGARIVYADNLYAYGPVDGPLTEDLPSRATGPNGRVRAALADELMAADAAGTVRATIGRASDYYGPWGRLSTVGERLFEPALAGKGVQLLADPDLPHTVTYVGDFARGLVTLGTHDAALGQVWHLPSAETLTSREFVGLVFEATGNPVKLGVLPSPMLTWRPCSARPFEPSRSSSTSGERPWVVDHSKFARAFGADVTPHPEAIDLTLAWYRAIGSSTGMARRS